MRIRRCAVPAALALLLGLMPTATLTAQQADDALIGTWEGSIDTGAAQLPIVFHVSRTDDGALTATMDSPAQGAFGIPMTSVSLEEGAVALTLAAASASYDGTLSEDGNSIEGTWTQGPASLPLNLTRSEEEGGATGAPARPQEPELPLPYREVEVSVPNPEADGVVLAGTLTLPEGEGPFPGAVLVTGSGPQNRDEGLMGHRPFYILADHLTRQGIAVLRYDDRGVAGSTGDFRSATSEDFASDAIAAVTFLQGHDEVKPGAVGIVGHSEGGLVGPMAAVRSDDVAFVVMLAGPGVTGAEIIQEQSALIARMSGADEATIERNRVTQTRMIDIVTTEPDGASAAAALREAMEEAVADLSEEEQEAARQQAEGQIAQANSPWFRFFLTYDPRTALREVDVPVLALFGEKDLQVPPSQSFEPVAQALDRGGDEDVTVRVLPGLNHLFQAAETGLPAEYATIEETMNPAALALVSGWILERFGG